MVISAVTKIYFSISLAPVQTTTTKTTTKKTGTTKTATANTYCYVEDTDYEGMDITNIGDNPVRNIANAHDCQEKCHFTQECTHWSYMPMTEDHEDKGNCWLKTGTGTIKSFPGLFSGPKSCHADGSASVGIFECTEAEGICTCKPNIVGEKCDKAAPGYYNFPEVIRKYICLK